ncbi:hypothetical protein PTKIN_Ptkin17bG0027500 [Pterospermum kingtungense]
MDDQALTMPNNPEATQERVTRNVSEMPKVDNVTANCSICIQSFSQSDPGDAKKVSCGHIFHKKVSIGSGEAVAAAALRAAKISRLNYFSTVKFP